MYGAILGDIIGSIYEFNDGPKKKEFPLFGKGCHFTDDSVMTIAVGDALINVLENGITNENGIKKEIVGSMRVWGKEYPHAGYGGMFRKWLSSDMGPYNSFGNGSAMRVSSVGWLFDTLEETKRMARYTAEVTHNHPEGIKGAEAVAVAIYLARTGKSILEISNYINENYYKINFKLDDIRDEYTFDVSCQGSVPQAIEAFLESTDFEDAIRNAISIGGDTDTIGAITGSIAEAYYGVPEELKIECLLRTRNDMRTILESFDFWKIKKDC